MPAQTLTPEQLRAVDAWWRAANYLSVGQIFLFDNPLLKRPLALARREAHAAGTLGHDPGPELHLRASQSGHREVRPRHDLHLRARATAAPRWSPTPISKAATARSIPTSRQDEAGLRKLFLQFSFPGGIPSHASPECPGSIHEGGELGYSLSHAFGAAFDNPDLIVACVVGDGEAETGPLATAWHSNKFLDPRTDGAVLPILHLNGYKIANPTLLARIPREELEQLLRGYGWTPLLRRAATSRRSCTRPWRRRSTRQSSRSASIQQRGAPRRQPGAPALADDRARIAQGLDRTERPSTASRSKVPFARTRCRCTHARNPAHLELLEDWLRSYRPGGTVR